MSPRNAHICTVTGTPACDQHHWGAETGIAISRYPDFKMTISLLSTLISNIQISKCHYPMHFIEQYPSFSVWYPISRFQISNIPCFFKEYPISSFRGSSGCALSLTDPRLTLRANCLTWPCRRPQSASWSQKPGTLKLIWFCCLKNWNTQRFKFSNHVYLYSLHAISTDV